MAVLALLRALPAVFAFIPIVSSTPLAARTTLLQHESRASGMWPSSVAGEAHDQTWPNFTEATERWSSYAAPTFNEVFLPKDEQDLSIGLEYMSSHNLTWLTKAGGHGYPTTLEVIQNAVLINMENFNYAYMQNNGSIVNGSLVLGAGVLFQQMIDTVGGAGRELTVGSCGCVGAGGAALGGGLGRLQGLHGLTSDALRAVRMVLWNGTMIQASNKVNQDLFWAVRGSGQNYGVITEYTYETWPATNGGMVYNADLTFTKDSIGQIVDTINNLTSTGLDSKLAILTYFAQDPTTSTLEIVLDIVYAGPKIVGQTYTKLFSSYSKSLVESVYPWTQLPTKSVLGLIPESCTDGPRYNLYSLIANTLDRQSFIDFGDAFQQFMLEYPLANNSALQIETFPVQGVKALPDDYSAFPHRNHFTQQIESVGRYTDDSVAPALNQFFQGWRNRFASPAVSGYDKLYIYQNYGHGDEPLPSLYGYDDWRHERLTNVKNAYDPHGFFNGYHPIPTSIAGWS